MTALLERTRKLAAQAWQETAVEPAMDGDLTAEEEAVGERIASAIRIRKPLHGLTSAGSREFSFSDIDLIPLGIDPPEYGHDYYFERITDDDGARKLAESLLERRTEPEWPVREWIERAREKGDCLVCVLDDSGDPAGFLAYSRDLIAFVEGDSVDLDYTVRPEYLYVSPEARGQGLSTALMGVVVTDIRDDLEHLSKKTDASAAKRLPSFSLRARLEAEAQSPAGEHFLDSLHGCFMQATEEVMGWDPEDPYQDVEAAYSL